MKAAAFLLFAVYKGAAIALKSEDKSFQQKMCQVEGGLAGNIPFSSC